MEGGRAGKEEGEEGRRESREEGEREGKEQSKGSGGGRIGKEQRRRAVMEWGDDSILTMTGPTLATMVMTPT